MAEPLLPNFYDVGTISVEAGETTFTITGGNPEAWVGDLLFLPSQPLVPAQRIKGPGELAYPWPGATETDAPYEVRYVGIIERSTAQSRRVLEQLGDVKSWADVFVATDADRLALESESKPLRAGLRVLVTEDGLIWAKASGAYGDWLPPVEFRGPQGNPGPYTDITFGPVTTVSPSTPASAVVVATGPAAIRIDLSIPKGLDGTGTGDFVGPNGGVVDGDLVAFSDATGKVGKKAGGVTNAQLANVPTATVKGRVAAGTGVPTDLTMAQLITSLRASGNYDRANILGTASQSGGVPTGAIIERGSNANGEYVRFADGTQICSIASITLSRSTGPTAQAVWLFPVTFLNSNVFCAFSIADVLAAGFREVSQRIISSSNQATLQVLQNGSWPDPTTFAASAFAIGRWF